MDIDQHPSSFPPEFHERLGRYVHICGHIEGAAWRVLVKHKHPKTLKLDSDLVEARKYSRKLFGDLRKAADEIPGDLGDRLSRLIEQVDTEIDARHLAVHGMWLKTYNPEQFSAEWFKNLNSRKDPDWRTYVAPISFADMDRYIEGASRILSEFLAIFSEMEGEDL